MRRGQFLLAHAGISDPMAAGAAMHQRFADEIAGQSLRLELAFCRRRSLIDPPLKLEATAPRTMRYWPPARDERHAVMVIAPHWPLPHNGYHIPPPGIIEVTAPQGTRGFALARAVYEVIRQGVAAGAIPADWIVWRYVGVLPEPAAPAEDLSASEDSNELG